MEEHKSTSTRNIHEWGTFILRLGLGAIMIAHGSQKLFGAFGGHGMNGTIAMVHSMGFPGAAVWAWMLVSAEFLGGIALIVGFLTRIAAAAIAIDMLVAIAKVHFKNGFFLPAGYEYPLALLAIAVSLMLTGAGRISLDWLLRNRYHFLHR